MKKQSDLKIFFLTNMSIILIGLFGLSGFDRHIFHRFVNENKYDGAIILRKWQQVHTGVEITCVVLIWLSYMLFAFNWNDSNRTSMVLVTASHAVIWTLIYVLYHFAGGAGLLS